MDNEIPVKSRQESQTNTGIRSWKSITKDKCELEGPYECRNCGGHIMLDATFLEQVENVSSCPYCGTLAEVID